MSNSAHIQHCANDREYFEIYKKKMGKIQLRQVAEVKMLEFNPKKISREQLIALIDKSW